MRYLIIILIGYTLGSCASTKIRKNTNGEEFNLSICDNVFSLEIDTINRIRNIESYRFSLNYDLGVSINVANAVSNTIHSLNSYGEPHTFIDSLSTKRVCILNLINSIDDIFLKLECNNREIDSMQFCFELISSQRRISQICTDLNSNELSVKQMKTEIKNMEKGELLLFNALKYKKQNKYYLIDLKGYIAFLKI